MSSVDAEDLIARLSGRFAPYDRVVNGLKRRLSVHANEISSQFH